MISEKSLEELIPEKLTDKEMGLLKKLGDHKKESQEVWQETAGYLMDRYWVENILNANYGNPKSEDINKVVYAVMIKKGYIFD